MLLSITTCLIIFSIGVYLCLLSPGYCHPKELLLVDHVPEEAACFVMDNPLLFSDRFGKRVRFLHYERREYSDQTFWVSCKVLSPQARECSQDDIILCSWNILSNSNEVRVVHVKNNFQEGFIP